MIDSTARRRGRGITLNDWTRSVRGSVPLVTMPCVAASDLSRHPPAELERRVALLLDYVSPATYKAMRRGMRITWHYEEVHSVVLDAAMEAAARWDEEKGLPLPTYFRAVANHRIADWQRANRGRRRRYPVAVPLDSPLPSRIGGVRSGGSQNSIEDNLAASPAAPPRRSQTPSRRRCGGCPRNTP